MRIALVTCEEFPDLTPDDRILRDCLQSRGAKAESLIWNTDQGESFDRIVIRSPWDYYLHPSAFMRWQEKRARSSVLLNPIEFLRWNIHKKYLLELSPLIPVIPTIWIEQNADQDFEVKLRAAGDRGWSRLVIKPAISASAYETKIVMLPISPTDAAWAKKVLQESDLLVQPFISLVQERGELSIVVIDSEITHVYLKKPATGDFRVQTEFGGSQELQVVSDVHREWASRAIQSAQVAANTSATPTYARIDLLPDGEKDWFLGELELIEPALQFHLLPIAAERMAEAILRMSSKS